MGSPIGRSRGSSPFIRTSAQNKSRVEWRVVTQDAEQRVTTQDAGNGLRSMRGFSAATGWLGSIATGLPSGAVTDNSIQNDTYTYDALGNLNSRTLESATGVLYSETFGYDGLNRVNAANLTTSGVPYNKTFGYDELGNINQKTGVGTYTYPAAGAARPHAPTSITGTVLGAANPTFNYDNNGNETSITSGAATVRSQTWTSFNMPLTITKGSTNTTFTYGPEQQRTKQTETNPTITIYYGGSIEKEVTASTTTIKTYLPRGIGYLTEVINSGSASLTASAIPARMYLHGDHLGSTIAITDEQRTKEALSYDVWGKRRNSDGSDGADTLTSARDRTGYTGQEHLDPVNLIHMNGRVYDPIVGKFISPDPTVPDPDNPQNFNRYAYVLNNPLNLTDPSGFSPMDLASEMVVQEDGSPEIGQTREQLQQSCAGGSRIACSLGGEHGATIVYINPLARFSSSMRQVINFVQTIQQSGGTITGKGYDVYGNVLGEASMSWSVPRASGERGEWITPAGRSKKINDYYTVETNGIFGDRDSIVAYVDRVGYPLYFNPSHGLLDLWESFTQKFFGWAGDALAQGFAEGLAEVDHPMNIKAHSQGVLTVVNAVKYYGLSAAGSTFEFNSAALSYYSAASVINGAGGTMRWSMPFGDIANVYAPSFNPLKWVSGFLDVFCLACTHISNGFGH